MYEDAEYDMDGMPEGFLDDPVVRPLDQYTGLPSVITSLKTRIGFFIETQTC